MIIVELAFTDDPRRLAARSAHRDLLAELHRDGVLLLAGPLDDDSGALLIFRAAESAVREILNDDPYYGTPGVQVVGVRGWRPVVGG